MSMGFYEEQALPRLVDATLSGKMFREKRARVASRLEGEVLEVGFGSGRNVPHYPAEVKRVLAVDPAAVGRKLASRRVAASPVPVEYVGLDGQDLPLKDSSVDHVLTTWTLCTIPDVPRALAEIRRVLRPGGRCTSWSTAARRPRGGPLAGPAHPAAAADRGGCHLNRPIDQLVANCGLRVTELETTT